MKEWPFGIGDARFVTVFMTGSRLPERGEPARFEKSADGRLYAHDSAGLPLGEVLDESSVLHLRHIREANIPYVAEVASIVARAAKLQLLVSRPTSLVTLPDTIRVVLSSKARKQILSRFRQAFGNLEPNKWLQETFVYQGRYLVRAPVAEKPNSFTLLSPVAQLNCEMRDSTFIWVINAGRLSRNAEGIFRRAGLIAGEVEWLSSETEVPEAAQGALDLLQAIATRSEYFDVWAKYRELELNMIRSRAAELAPLDYRRRTYSEQVVRFELEPDSDTARWQDCAGGLSVELVISRKRRRPGATEPDTESTMLLGAIRRIGRDFIDIDRPDEEFSLPPRGKLRVSPLGDEVRLARQQVALERLHDGTAPIPNLEAFLTTGGTSESIVYRVAGFPEHPQAMADGKRPTPRQVQAVDIALNTPDICVIQGPPGTGKTAVIRTILKRLKEEGRRHLLISSYQHNAVDNALDGLQACGVMSYRLGGSESGGSYHSHEIDDWVARVAEAVGESLRRLQPKDGFYLQRRQLKDLALSALEARVDLPGCLELLTKVNTDYSSALTPHIAEQARQLQLEIQTHLVQRQPLGSGGLDVSKLAKLIAQIPSDGDDPQTTRTIGEIRVEIERICSHGWGDPEASRQFKLHAVAIRHLIVEVQLGQDRTTAALKLGAELAAARTVASEFVSQCELSSKIAAAPATSAADQNLLLAFDRWCRAAAEVQEQEMLASKDHVPSILDQWRYDITSHPTRVKEVLRKHADVWGITCQQVAAQRFGLYDEEFDYVVIDEAARASPLDLLIPLVRARRIVLVGDQMQLPHPLDYQLEREFEAAAGQPEQKRVLKESLFARLYDQLPPAKRVRLNYQYRMNPVISRMVSDIFYHDDPLLDDPSTSDLVNDTGLFEGRSLVWSDVAPPDGTKKLEQGQYYNGNEVDMVVSYMRDLLETDTPHSIGVITFYAQQRDRIQRSLRDRVTGAQNVLVGTVDAFQGMQRDIILLSMVRSNPERRLGFLNSPNRLNVSLSRARRLLVLIGDSATATSNPYLNAVYDYCRGVNSVIHQL